MRLLVVIGAGASFDCWPYHVIPQSDWQKLPLANDLFSPDPIQNSFLNKYHLVGLASTLRQKARYQNDSFDIEAELAGINDNANKRGDFNTLQNLFKARFYLHSLIWVLSQKTLQYTSSHTVYVDLLNQLKGWIDQSPSDRFVDIVVFNYDDLVERAMENVYNYDWYSKNKHTPLSAYYSGKNLRIYKPHGSVNWGRDITKNDSVFSYNAIDQAFHDFNEIEILNSFEFINPDIFNDADTPKTYVPAIAIPFKGKINFQECPQEMHKKMVEAIRGADKLISLGWKGADEHFTSLLKQENDKLSEVYVVSPKAETQLDSIYPANRIKPYESTFRHFVSDSPALETVLGNILK